jgi:hypothetical protein
LRAGTSIDHNGGRHPAERTTPGGTSSMWMRTGMRCAKRTQVKVGLRVRDVDRAGDAVDAPARDLIMTHQLNLGPIAHADGSKIRLIEISVGPE